MNDGGDFRARLGRRRLSNGPIRSRYSRHTAPHESSGFKGIKPSSPFMLLPGVVHVIFTLTCEEAAGNDFPEDIRIIAR